MDLSTIMNSKPWRRVFGDHRDQRVALREAGFVDEAQATAWAATVVGDPRPSQVQQIKRVREARPDLGLRTATYIVRQLAVRQP